MPRRPAIVTQADVARVVRAAKVEGACAVEVMPSGSILVHLTPVRAAPQGVDSKNLKL